MEKTTTTLDCSQGKTSPNLADSQCVVLPSSVGRDRAIQVSENRLSHIEQLHQLMTVSFIRWHLNGGFEQAADYTLARRAWESALMEAIKHNGEQA